MQDLNKDQYSYGDALKTFRAVIRALLQKWYLLIIAGLAGSVFGAGYFFLQKPKYDAECTFILEEKQGGIGGLSGLASQFGFDIGGMGGGSLFAGDNILEILKSGRIIQATLLSRVDTLDNRKLIDLYLEASGLKADWAKNERLKGISFEQVNSNKHDMSLQQDSVLQLVRNSLIKKDISVSRLIKKGSMIQVTVTSANEMFAKLMSERMVANAMEMYTQIKTSNASTNVRRLEHKADSLLGLLNIKTYQTAGAFVVDANPALRILSVPAEVRMRDKTVLQTLYAEVVKNLELSKIALMQQTPVIQVIDAPAYPLVNKNKNLGFLLIVFFIIGAFICASYILVKTILSTEK